MRCEEHPRYKGGGSPHLRKKGGANCETCWKIHWENKGVPYNPETMRSLAKVHTRYYQKSGEQVQGITTIIGNHNGDKGGMVYSAWKLGLEGINYKEEWAQKADAGTLAHELIRAYLLGIEYDPRNQYGRSMVAQAEVAFQGFLNWHGKYSEITPVIIEEPMVSEDYPYGFTLDYLAYLDGDLCLVDFKTGKDIYWNHRVQLAGIKLGLIEKGYKVDKVICLHIKKGEEDAEGNIVSQPEFTDKEYPNLRNEVEWFKLIVQANKYYNRIAKGWR